MSFYLFYKNTIFALSKILMIYLVSCFFLCCNSQANMDSNHLKNNARPQTMNGSFEVLNFDKQDIPKACAYEGEIIAGVKWRDKRGLNYMLISGFDEGDFFSETWKSKLFAYAYQIQDGETQLSWKIKDFNPNVFSAVQLAKKTVQVVDVDKDGIGEPSFLYSIEPDGLDPATLKLMCFYKDKKAAIRGQLPRQEDDFEKYYQKNIDPTTKNLPRSVQQHLSKLWDDFVTTYKDENFDAPSSSANASDFSTFVGLFPKLALPFLVSDTETKFYDKGEVIPERLTRAYMCDQDISRLLCVATKADTESEGLDILNHFYPIGKVKLSGGWILVYQLDYLGYYENIIATYTSDGTLMSRVKFSGTDSDYRTRDGEIKANLRIVVEEIEYQYGKKGDINSIKNSNTKTYTIDKNHRLRDTNGNIIKDKM